MALTFLRREDGHVLSRVLPFKVDGQGKKPGRKDMEGGVQESMAFDQCGLLASL